MKRILAAVFFLSLLVLIFLPHQASAINIWQGASCGGETPIAADGGPEGPCDFCDALIVTRNIIEFLLELSFIVATGMIVYGALRLVISAGSPNAVSEAKKTIINALIGLTIALCSWLIVNTVIGFLAPDFTLPWNDILCR